MPPSDPRRLAWEALIAVEDGAFADAELGWRLAGSGLPPRDRALATALVYGTLAWQGLLDPVIAACGRRPHRLDVPVRTLLRLALFQLVKLSRVPDFAVVSTTVELAKRFRRGAAAGMVNAVLRRFLREGKRVPVPSRTEDIAGHLAVTCSHPRWLVEYWLAELGVVQTEALLRANNEPAPTVLRVNPLHAGRDAMLQRLQRANLAARATSISPDGIILQSGCDLTGLPGFANGALTSQGEASQLMTWLLGARAGDRILDACAGQGGKATHVGERLGNQGLVVAVDRGGPGLVRLRRAAGRLGLTCIGPVRADAVSLPLKPEPVFDAVLLDAPCSGLGTLRQHPEIKWRQGPERLAQLAAVQQRLLAAVAPCVRHGGALVYATCTITSIENERVVAEFLARHRDFAIDDPRLRLPVAARPFVDAQGFFHTFPHSDGLDGFFAARLKRCGDLRMVRS